MEPLDYFAIPNAHTEDARILKNLSRQYGSWLENLDSESKLAIRAVLTRYVYFKRFYIHEFLIVDALADAIPDYNDLICNILMSLQGLSDRSCEILIKLITLQQIDSAAD